jgi:hypothetical protein
MCESLPAPAHDTLPGAKTAPPGPVPGWKLRHLKRLAATQVTLPGACRSFSYRFLSGMVLVVLLLGVLVLLYGWGIRSKANAIPV